MRLLSARRMIRLTAALLAAALLIACAPAPAAAPTPTPQPTDLPPSPTFTPAPTPIADPTATPPPPTATPAPPQAIGPGDYPPGVNPLTGLPVDDPSVLQRRPLLIKISNSPPIVRPQSGLNTADLIFEYYVEGGWTRFAAIFYSKGVDHVGSVRSGRLVDLQLSHALDALWVFSGASLGVLDTIRASDLYPYDVISPQFGYAEPYFVRFPRGDLPVEHTLFTDTAQLWQLAADRKVRATPRILTEPGLAFDAVPPDGGIPARSATIDYNKTHVEWRYDAVSGEYLRWTDNIPHTDALTGQQVAIQNVVVMSAYHELQELFPEKYFGKEKSWYIELTGNGQATLLRDGQAYDGRWVRTRPDDMFTFVDVNGNPLMFKPGRTFFQITSSYQGAYTANGPEELVITP